MTHEAFAARAADPTASYIVRSFRRSPRVLRRLFSFSTLVALAACSHSPAPEPAASPVRVAAPDAKLTCAQWVEKAVASPELDVERVPEPLAYEPPPLPKRLPKGTVGKDGKAEVRVKVVVDTLGKADMRTFTVVKTTHPRLATLVKSSVAKWTFRPAEVGGCKVPRIFNWAAVSGGKPAS
jgi:hypothetical protein